VTGTLVGIARHKEKRGEIERCYSVLVTKERGVEGDARGDSRAGKNKRQITIMEIESWDAAVKELGLDECILIPWWKRRNNLLVSGFKLPREIGTVISIGETLQVQVTGECDPCKRMDEVHGGLQKVLEPDWRGGITGIIIESGVISLGDTVDYRP
jgi:MOSC domain-containing protein YiiM